MRGASPTSSLERELSVTDDSVLGDLSADGSAALLYDRDGLFLRPTDGSPPLRLSERFDGGRLSPDGKWVLAISPAKSYPMLIPVGAGEVRLIGTQACDGAEWFPDGKRILCEIWDSAPPFRLLALELPAGKATEIPVAADAAADLNVLGPLSPDGAFLVALGRGGDYWIVPLAGGASRRVVPGTAGFDHGTFPAGWSGNGRQLFIESAGKVPNAVQRLDLATGRVEPWKELTWRIGPASCESARSESRPMADPGPTATCACSPTSTSSRA